MKSMIIFDFNFLNFSTTTTKPEKSAPILDQKGIVITIVLTSTYLVHIVKVPVISFRGIITLHIKTIHSFDM